MDKKLIVNDQPVMRFICEGWNPNRILRNNKTPLTGVFCYGGEGGIRTREPLWVTRFPSVRAKPDYATSPCPAGELYHVKLLKKIRPSDGY